MCPWCGKPCSCSAVGEPLTLRQLVLLAPGLGELQSIAVAHQEPLAQVLFDEMRRNELHAALLDEIHRFAERDALGGAVKGGVMHAVKAAIRVPATWPWWPRRR